MKHEVPQTNYWALSSSQLAAQIGLIANGNLSAIDDTTRVEAGLLVAEWQDALKTPRTTLVEEENRVAQLAGLKKRTIEILIKASQGE
jgi:hypothetical protein